MNRTFLIEILTCSLLSSALRGPKPELRKEGLNIGQTILLCKEQSVSKPINLSRNSKDKRKRDI